MRLRLRTSFNRFVQRTPTLPFDMPATQVCVLCEKGFMDPPALWRHCDAEHHSWTEAVKRALWEADKLEDLPMLTAWKRRIIANFTAALTYSRPGHGHYGRMKVCMRQLVGCVTCARVDWINEFVTCYLFKDCPEKLLAQDDGDSDLFVAGCPVRKVRPHCISFLRNMIP